MNTAAIIAFREELAGELYCMACFLLAAKGILDNATIEERIGFSCCVAALSGQVELINILDLKEIK